MEKEITIVGAGLSGLVSGYEMQKRGWKFRIIEARNTPGGRIRTIKNANSGCYELGATWFGSQHTELIKLLNELKIEAFEQYRTGCSMLFYDQNKPVYSFETPDNEPPSYRIMQGTIKLIESLFDKVKDSVQFETVLNALEESEHKLKLITNRETFETDVVISTIPPRLFSKGIECSPPIKREILQKLDSIPSWMGHSIKFILEFEAPFWKAKEMSGTFIGQIGPVIEIYDHSGSEGNSFALMGFAHPFLSKFSMEERKHHLLNFLEHHYGSEILSYKNYFENDWSKEGFTTTEGEERMIPKTNFGDEVFNCVYMNEKLILSGTESAKSFPGYMEGAVISGQYAVSTIEKMLTHPVS